MKRKLGIFAIAIVFIGIIVCRLHPPEIQLGYSREIWATDSTLLNAFLSPDEKWRLETKEGQLPYRLKKWILWKEDKYFYFHPGVNPISVVQSGWKNLLAGKRLSGASTITMQAVKMHRRRPRTWIAKLIEAVQAIRWECGLSKDEILNFYLSNLPFGGNVEGFRAASLLYFGKDPHQLSLAESAALVVIPNQPNRYHPVRNPQNLVQKRNEFLTELKESGLITPQEWKSASLEPLVARYHKMPNEVPHLAQHQLAAEGNPIITTIDPKKQRTLNRMFLAYAQRMKRLGVQNASLVVADHHAHTIVTWIGNPDFNDEEHAGQVDGVMAIRSPGSTLKPFIYALGLQKGIITPKTILYDVPSEFGTYVPENFNTGYLGAVNAEDALLQSLNIPAISLLKEVTVDTFLHYTDGLGMKLLRSKTMKPGLSMAVGGCGTSLLELTNAYTVLANKGLYQPIKYINNHPESRAIPVFLPMAPIMIRNMLSATRRQEAIIPFVQNPSKFEGVCWKTGTSFGHRDAWCLGFGSRYTVGIWFGNFSGEGRPGLTGIDVAAPVFQQIMALLESEAVSEKLPDPINFGWKQRSVCRVTGLLPGPACSDKITDWYFPLISSPKVCDHLIKIATDLSESISYCAVCKPAGGGTRSIWKANYPPEYVQFLLSQNKKTEQPPPHNPACMVSKAEDQVQIISPLSGKQFFLEDKPRLKLPVRVFSQSGNYPVKVYLNGKEMGESRKGEDLWLELAEGNYSITATDSRGQTDRVTFLVSAF